MKIHAIHIKNMYWNTLHTAKTNGTTKYLLEKPTSHRFQ